MINHDYPGVVLRAADDEVVVVQHEALHVAHLVEGLAGDLPDAVVRQVDDLHLG